MKIEFVEKRYGKRTILKGVTFEAEPGMCVGLLGGNGSGKSTLLNILAGVIKCDKGRFEVGSIDLLKNSRLRNKIVGYVPQNTPLFDELTAYDNLRLWYSAADIKKELSGGVLGLLGIEEFLKVPVCKMSGGMKKRLSIGCSVAGDPKILLMDEPSAALDLKCKKHITDYIERFKSQGGTVILATHDIQEIPVCDRLYILKNGSLAPYVYDGDIERLTGSL